MRLFNRKVLDCVIAGSGSIMYLAQPTEDLLASVEKLAFMLVVDGVAGTSPQISLQAIYGYFFAAHGWFNASNAGILAPTSVLSNTTNVIVGSLSGISGIPVGMQGNARFYVQITGTNPSARVRVYACGRGCARKLARRMAEHEMQLTDAALEQSPEIEDALRGRMSEELELGEAADLGAGYTNLDRLTPLPEPPELSPSARNSCRIQQDLQCVPAARRNERRRVLVPGPRSPRQAPMASDLCAR